MTTQIGKTTDDERGLLPYSVIIAATKGEPQAMNIVCQHYAGYIAHLSMRKLRDERGNTYYGIDEDIRDRLRYIKMSFINFLSFFFFYISILSPVVKSSSATKSH